MGKNKTKKKNNEVMKLILILAVGIMAIVGLVILSVPKDVDKSEYTKINFSDMYIQEGATKEVSQKIQLLDGQKVMMSGYMAEQSPVDGSFIYLVNQPYVVCPFCTVGDITKLEVMTIMMANGTEISFRTNAVEIYGTLEVAPKVDSFGYTTQFRILADRIENLEETEGNAEVDAYYYNLNEGGMILDIQTLQMNIDGVTNPDTFKLYYNTDDPILVVDAIKSDTSSDYDFYKQYFVSKGMDTENLSGQRAYVMYIKECPDIIQGLKPANEDLAKLNDELIEIYNKEIPIMEKVMSIVEKIKTEELSDEQKVEAYNSLIDYKDENLKLFDEFNKWNNKLRE